MLNKIVMQVKRELWENKIIVFAIPIIFSAALIMGVIGGLSYSMFNSTQASTERNNINILMFSGKKKNAYNIINNTNWFFEYNNEKNNGDMSEIDEEFESSRLLDDDLNAEVREVSKYQSNPIFYLTRVEGFNSIVNFLFLGLILIYLSSGMNRDRKDNSIYFWRSLPVSETQHVLTKLFVAILILPLSYCFINIVTAFVVSLLLAICAWIYLPSEMNNTIEYYYIFVGATYEMAMSALNVWLMSVFALPVIGWAMIFSAYFNRLSLVIMLIPLFVIYVVEKIFHDKTYIGEIMQTYISSAAHSLHLIRVESTIPSDIGQFVIGSIIGVLLIASSIAIRRWKID